MIAVQNIIRTIQRMSVDSNITKLNILAIGAGNEKYISLLSQTENNFYFLPEQPWNPLIESLPSKSQNINMCTGPLDYILCCNRAEQYDQAQQLSKQLHLPIILVDMCSRMFIRPQHLGETVTAKNADLLNKEPCFQVACNKHIQSSWNSIQSSMIIPIGIDSTKFHNTEPPEQNPPLIVIDNHTPSEVGHMVERRIGSSYQLIPTDHKDLNDISVNKARYFINTYKTVTIKMLEAMSAETVVIALKNPDTESVIDHLSTGILIETLDEIPAVLNMLEPDPDGLRFKIGKLARKKIISEHPLDEFVNRWNKVFEKIRPSFYTPSL